MRVPSTTTGTTRRPPVSLSSSGIASGRTDTSTSVNETPRACSSARLAAHQKPSALTYSVIRATRSG